MRLSKFLSESGVAARRKCEAIILARQVTVNGKIADKPQHQIDPELDTILLAGKQIKRKTQKVYYLLNKPTGLICSAQGKSSILSLFPLEDGRLFTVGRLDKETSGLILITNDGHFAHAAIHPSKGHVREYVAKTNVDLTDTHLKRLSAGVRIDEKVLVPVRVKKVRKGTVKISVNEGKKHEVRELLMAAGLTVLELKRIRLGPLTLGMLPEGSYRSLSEKEIEQFLCS